MNCQYVRSRGGIGRIKLKHCKKRATRRCALANDTIICVCPKHLGSIKAYQRRNK